MVEDPACRLPAAAEPAHTPIGSSTHPLRRRTACWRPALLAEVALPADCKKCLDVSDDLLPLLREREQVPTLEQDEARVRDAFAHLFGQRQGCDVVGPAVQDESWVVDLAQSLSAVEPAGGDELSFQRIARLPVAAPQQGEGRHQHAEADQPPGTAG